jgi:hypothetical protein
MNTDSNVCVLCRQSDGDTEQCGLVLGVFPTPDAAKAFAESMEHVPADAWQPPRPGKRRWMLPRKHYVFTIEEFPVRTDSSPLTPLTNHFAAD